MLVLIAFFVFSALAIAFVVYWCSTRAVIFARGVLALCVALLLSNNGYEFVPDRAFLNFVAWALLCFFVVYFLSMFPRVDISTRFFCTIVVSLVTTELVGMLIGIIFNNDTAFEISLFHEVVNKVLSVGFAIFGIWVQGKKLPSESSHHLLVRFFDRFIASVFYMISIVVLSLSFHAYYEIPTPVLLVLAIGGLVGPFVADIFFADKILFGYTALDEIEMPR